MIWLSELVLSVSIATTILSGGIVVTSKMNSDPLMVGGIPFGLFPKQLSSRVLYISCFRSSCVNSETCD